MSILALTGETKVAARLLLILLRKKMVEKEITSQNQKNQTCEKSA